ncbi:putative hydrogenase expression/formation protein [Clostridium pasteurianum DSM 525 = ATCC 6013]|uniref:AIR synthase related protein domain protein n=1 Tax=Clostridium pasteurianum DSM 525 = ATCC 6013 TaxID=1262449 RepID=A0A0H3J6B2_CLOPA|nr:AIR synthase family protein [Clostridium pasteurianum]AJA47443.1 putative hydrogenase expression/formation protein [Clostridium pasteurianum DSM 525 = ATCC 6013]AJA51431.1 putative hydrogenase expression/formation protein [Clostridium pasteurianum DSM 525 = ATCC 6013]AOZ74769.1 AIR synthase [Clostridium pasteurianum DSM 525 = ATCC 6013]AOZ78565.1 AIR synthase [Clostridium pasteurianum]ELP58778.1 hydrogenase maturation factor [Clostridium pasteurianum DSM 525 = ATCC 6013]
MKVGKLDSYELQKIIDNNRGIKREDVRIRGGIGEDCSVIEFGDFECVVSTDPITGAEKGLGKLAVHINCNDIASAGVEPLGILVTIMAPESSTLIDIKNVMEEISEECKKLNLEILGGHTEVTSAVNRMIVSCTVLGKGRKNSSVSTADAKPGDDIIITKKLGMEGTFIAVSHKEDELINILTEEEIKEARGYIESISVVDEGRICGRAGVNSMHDITEGGVLGALWEVSKASNCGFKICYDFMPISEVTRKVCKKFNIDPLRFISSGSMLVTCKDGNKLVDLLKKNNIESVIIGNITEDKNIIIKDGKEEEVDPPDSDELFKIMK